jgi:hypothetical protein
LTACSTSTGTDHQCGSSAAGTTSTVTPIARPAAYSPRPGRPITAASSAPWAVSRHGRNRSSPSIRTALRPCVLSSHTASATGIRVNTMPVSW